MVPGHQHNEDARRPRQRCRGLLASPLRIVMGGYG